MNVYLVTSDHELITPELNGSILEGVTRDSILTLASEFGLTPVERRIGIDELLEGIGSGQVAELFACGTAAVITPIGSLQGRARQRTWSAAARPARPPPPCARTCWTSSTAAPRTPTAGCAGFSEPAAHARAARSDRRACALSRRSALDAGRIAPADAWLQSRERNTVGMQFLAVIIR